MYDVAKNEQTLTMETEKKKRMRMLMEGNSFALSDHGRMLSEVPKQSIGPLWKLDIFYESRTPNAKHGIFYKESLEEINELLNMSPSDDNQIDWNTVNQDIPEAEELATWKEVNQTIYSISDNNDDEMIDLD